MIYFNGSTCHEFTQDNYDCRGKSCVFPRSLVIILLEKLFFIILIFFTNAEMRQIMLTARHYDQKFDDDMHEEI